VNVEEATYVGETAERISEHRQSLIEGLLEKSKLAQHAYEEGYRVSWDDARILETEGNSRHRNRLIWHVQ
jgi:hypothetical protein